MDNNNFFSFLRIAMVMKRDIMENWKTNFYRLLGLYAAFLLSMIFNLWGMSANAKNTFIDPDTYFNRYCANLTGAFILITGICCLIYASNVMENMNTKEKRIATLMLPATMIEKFVANFLMVTVGFVVSVMLTVSLAEATRFLLMPLFNLPDIFYHSSLPNILSMVFTHAERSWANSDIAGTSACLLQLLGWSWVIWQHSLYILGGNYWYKKPFFKTLGMLMLISIVGSIAMVHLLQWIDTGDWYSLGEWLDENFQWLTLNKLFSLGIAFFSAFTMFNWWLSYRLFTRSQIIKPKFRLL